MRFWISDGSLVYRLRPMWVFVELQEMDRRSWLADCLHKFDIFAKFFFFGGFGGGGKNGGYLCNCCSFRFRWEPNLLDDLSFEAVVLLNTTTMHLFFFLPRCSRGFLNLEY